VQQLPDAWPGVGLQGPFGAPQPPLALVKLARPDQVAGQRDQRGRDDGLRAPAVPVGERDRLPATPTGGGERADPRRHRSQVAVERDVFVGLPGDVGRVERNLYWVTDGTYQAAFLTTPDGVVLFDAPPIGHNLQRAIDEIAAANGVPNTVTHLIYSHHHADHADASSLFGDNVVRIGHEETRRLLLRDDDPARPAPTETFQDRRTLDIGGERIELAWHGANHTPDNSIIHLPDHDTLMLIDIVNPGWAPVYLSNLTENIPGYLQAPATALSYPWKHFIGGHLGQLGTRDDVRLHQQYMADIAASVRTTLPTIDPTPYFQQYGLAGRG
jgi:glyoxylase-like metal-dependent hydrolase (beta-lactamase superfamily II)